ncbi:Glycoside hydrolase/deacetylase, beta/alpha-barrel [Acididesulfobacillus acetoxydans]|uniref:Glycoside hydrolase/deacetylase, beta/alpha-barrel n=1 Tax=Acididesulfobacillus acetoxydans TaxID=1561005 RepID=A0A8S0W7V0_9FIRM|nr:polysaccharide deacetylase family protein [Acididesulfobacillus acetoxydans]CAA7601159.1 Glycoside hydrolase/deacetylase, beta/alpha-barrel [Acididesulfobacillus acetoxydans]CEJ08562.1 Polysaccharide deacetylase sporulation protein PdaB [Acididesulfobacillus acetoxydans]
MKRYVVLLAFVAGLLGVSFLVGRPHLGEAGEGMSGSRKITTPSSVQDVLVEVPTEKKSVALTFDDGPDISTESLLAVLRKYHVKATFFVVGDNCRLYPDVLKRMAAEGHEIENHTYTHLRFRGKTLQQIATEIDKTNRVIQQITGRVPEFFRPPGGTINEKILQAAQEANLRVVLWTPPEDSKDWCNPGVGNIIRNVVRHIKRGSIILMHDGGGPRQQTVQSLPTIIETLEKEGYRFVTVKELLNSEVKTLQPLPGP